MDTLKFDVVTLPVGHSHWVVISEHSTVIEMSRERWGPPEIPESEILCVTNPGTLGTVEEILEYCKSLPTEQGALSAANQVLVNAGRLYRNVMLSDSSGDLYDNSINNIQRNILLRERGNTVKTALYNWATDAVILSVQNKLPNNTPNCRLWNVYLDIGEQVAIYLKDSQARDNYKFVVHLHDRVSTPTTRIVCNTQLRVQTIEISAKPSEILKFSAIPDRSDIKRSLGSNG